MAKQKWIDEGSIFFPIPGNTVLHTTPGPGVWQVVQHPSPQDGRLGLARVSDKFEFPGKVYDLGGTRLKERIKKVWESDVFVDGKKNLGIILNGVKGGGKSWFAKVLCNELDMPVVIVDSSFDGRILGFIQSLCFECTVLIDEAEKTFKKGEEDEILLKLIDGIYNESRKLYILTTNTLNVNENLLGRPGRIRYVQEFKNLPASVISEYIDDTLKDLSLKDEIMQKVDLLEISTIDILKSIVDEYNILGKMDDDNDPMNIPMAKHIFDTIVFEGCTKDDIPEIEKIIIENKDPDISIIDWLGENWKEGPEEDSTNQDRFEENIKACSYAYKQKLTSAFSKFWRDSGTSQGTVIEEPNENGFMILQDRWSGDDRVVLILRQRNNPSLYRGGLLI